MTKSETTNLAEIPFIENAEISSGKEERIKLFAALAANKNPVPLDWFLETLGSKKKPLQKQSLPSMLKRYGYTHRHATTTEGLAVIFISVREDSKEE